jgi:serine/threonine protein kinase
LHEKGICHRDIKPDNIIFNSQTSIAKIFDFNVSRKFENKEFKMLTQVGIDSWIAPEMLSGEFYDEKVDIWSAGCLLYYIIAGE